MSRPENLTKLTSEQSEIVANSIRLVSWFLKKHGRSYVEFFGWEECYSMCCLALCRLVRGHKKELGSLSSLVRVGFMHALENERIKQTVSKRRGESRRSLPLDGNVGRIRDGWSFVDAVDLSDSIESLPGVQKGYILRFLENGGSIRQSGLEVGVSSSAAYQAFFRGVRRLRESYV